jgi:hypothetical protein
MLFQTGTLKTGDRIPFQEALRWLFLARRVRRLSFESRVGHKGTPLRRLPRAPGIDVTFCEIFRAPWNIRSLRNKNWNNKHKKCNRIRRKTELNLQTLGQLSVSSESFRTEHILLGKWSKQRLTQMGSISPTYYGSSTRTHFGAELFQLVFYRNLLCSNLNI